jgi:hypothetical protein
MSTHEREEDGSGLPPRLREALAALPREREPGALLEERTVRALRARGLVTARARRIPAPWLGGAVAAGFALFAAGLATGQWLGARQAADLVSTVRMEDSREAAMAVQRTGSAYVQTLARLAARSDTTGTPPPEPAREVAARMLRSAADELVRIAPDDPVAAAVLAAFARDTAPPAPAAARERVVWF